MLDHPETQALIQHLGGPLAQQQDRPWLPRQQETAEDYYAFRLWLEMGPSRPKVQSLLAQTLAWEARANAYDLFRHENPEPEIQTPEARRRQDASTIQVLKHTLKGQAIRLMSQLERSTSPAMTLEQLTKCADVLVKLDRLVHDQSTENVGVVVKDLSRLTDEDLASLALLAEKVGEVEE